MATQLALDFERPRHRATGAEAGERLLATLRALGLSRIERCRLTRNRNVMVSFSGATLRVHEGYLTAPVEVLRAIVVFVEGRTRAERRTAQRIIVGHPISSAPESARRPRTRPEDRGLVVELTRWHQRYNSDHFHGRLSSVTLRVSRRMRSRLGHYTCAVHGQPAEIAISWRHIKRDGWEEACHTLLHEMVHQWQAETGRPIDHGRDFRAKAREVGVTPSARRTLARGTAPRRETGRIGRRAARDE
jgi:SprT-like family protein